jgi:hypothetical protein
MSETEYRTLTEEELAKLPRWAVVAFAARCARRLQPVFVKKAKQAGMTEKHLNTVDKAISLAEDSAANPASASEKACASALTPALATLAAARAPALAGAARALAGSGASVFSTVRDPGALDADVADNAADAGGLAVAALAFATRALAARDDAGADVFAPAPADARADFLVFAPAHALARVLNTAARALDTALARALDTAIRRDYDLLLADSQPGDRGEHGWDNDTPVPPTFFGPLWPEGVPKGLGDDESERSGASGSSGCLVFLVGAIGLIVGAVIAVCTLV